MAAAQAVMASQTRKSPSGALMPLISSYMRISSRTGGVAGLLGSMVVSVALGAGVRAYYWHGLSDSVVGWAVWFVVLMAPALFSAALRRLRPSRSAGP